MALAANRDHHWKITAESMGQPELATDPRFSTNTARSANRDVLEPILSGWLLTLTNSDISRLLGGKVPIGPVNNAADLFNDPHLRIRDMIVAVEQPGSDTPVEVAGQPLKFSRTNPGIASRAPVLGEQNFEHVHADWATGTRAGVRE